jgi:hypothetical protein
MSVLGPLIQELLKQVGPQAQQFITSPAFPELLKNLAKIPPPLIGAALKELNEVPAGAQRWYNSLSPDGKKRIDDAITWALKDVFGHFAKEITGLPIDKLVEMVVEKARADPRHDALPQDGVDYIKHQVEQRMYGVRPLVASDIYDVL